MLTLGSEIGPNSFQLTLKCGSFGFGMLILIPPKAFMIFCGMLEIAFHALSIGFSMKPRMLLNTPCTFEPRPGNPSLSPIRSAMLTAVLSAASSFEPMLSLIALKAFAAWLFAVSQSPFIAACRAPAAELPTVFAVFMSF